MGRAPRVCREAGPRHSCRPAYGQSRPSTPRAHHRNLTVATDSAGATPRGSPIPRSSSREARSIVTEVAISLLLISHLTSTMDNAFFSVGKATSSRRLPLRRIGHEPRWLMQLKSIRSLGAFPGVLFRVTAGFRCTRLPPSPSATPGHRGGRALHVRPGSRLCPRRGSPAGCRGTGRP